MALLSVSTETSRSYPFLFLSFCALSRSHTSPFFLSISSSRRSFQPLSSSSSSSSSSTTALRRLSRCRAATQDPPPPHLTDPPPGDDPKDIAASLSKIQDRVQIFLAVLFWMSLFFWASAWDGRSRPNKGSRFRK